MQSQGRIFGIGLSKTGTSSLNRALSDLGIPSIHYPCDPTTYQQLISGDYRLKILDRYEAATDIPVVPFFPQLDKEYPGSKFILTVRDLESWLKSVEHHWTFMLQWAQHDKDFRAFSEFIIACVYGVQTFHRERFAYVYRQHLQTVHSYFADRNGDLLVMDVCRGEGWEALCPFLEIPIPDLPFPHTNRKEEKQDRVNWIELLDSAIVEFRRSVPISASYILIDDFQLAGSELAEASRTFRLGGNEGAPSDSAKAVAELERIRLAGAEFVLVAWPCFWWRDYYDDFWDYLNKESSLVSSSTQLIVFRLRDRKQSPSSAQVSLRASTQGAYTTEYYSTVRKSSSVSAEVVTPWIINLVQPQSVVDVGCGTGEWLASFKRHGVKRVLGIDGDYIDLNTLSIPSKEFLAADLTKPLNLDRRFDLAISLEVAEHLPPESAHTFVESLAQLASVVLFSAAVPHQGGLHHVNEQWPGYWVELFATFNLVPVDVVRPQFWSQAAVQWWYAQNTLLFLRREKADQLIQQENHWLLADGNVPSLVHPRNFIQLAWQNRVLESAVDLASVVPRNASVLLVDEDLFGSFHCPGRTVLPFPAINGNYAGPPADDSSALMELDLRQQEGIEFIAFGWPAFWWLDHYTSFGEALRTKHRLVLQNERLIVFGLRQ